MEWGTEISIETRKTTTDSWFNPKNSQITKVYQQTLVYKASSWVFMLKPGYQALCTYILLLLPTSSCASSTILTFQAGRHNYTLTISYQLLNLPLLLWPSKSHLYTFTACTVTTIYWNLILYHILSCTSIIWIHCFFSIYKNFHPFFLHKVHRCQPTSVVLLWIKAPLKYLTYY